MNENNETVKPITYIEKGNYLFNIIKIIPHSPTNIEKIGITIYRKTLEINFMSEASIDLLLNNKSNFVESYANIGFVNLHGFLAFIYASNEDIKEKEKMIVGNNQYSFIIKKLYNIHCFIISYYVPSRLRKKLKNEFVKIGKYLVEEELYFCHNPYRFDIDICNQIHIFQDKSFKYKLFNESFQYNEKFSPKICKKILTYLVKGFFKHIVYNTLSNEKEKDYINIALRFKAYENNNYLIEVEMFIASFQNKKYFQNLFYLYYNSIKDDKISNLKNLLEKWENNINNVTFYDKIKNSNSKYGIIINLCDSNNNSLLEEKINNLNNIEIFNINLHNDNEIEKNLNNYLKDVGYNYKFNNTDYNSQNKLLVVTGYNFEILFSFSKIVAFTMYATFLKERGIPNNIINNRKEEFYKNFKYFEKKVQKFHKKENIKIQFVEDLDIFKDCLYSENLENNFSKRKSLNINIGDKEFIMITPDKNEDNEFVIIDTLKNNDNEIKNIDNKLNDNNKENDIKNINNNNIKEEKNEENSQFDELLYENINPEEKSEKENLEENIEKIENNENNSNNISDYQFCEEDNNLNINEEKNILSKQNTMTIFIGTFNVNALESDLIKSINLEEFLFPEKLKEHFHPDNIPTFYCIGLEETVELNTKNVLIKPKNKNNKADLWEERISGELQQRYNYFLQCKLKLVGILLLVYVKSTEIKYLNDIHVNILKSGFIGLGNKGCCFFEVKYKNLAFGFCSCHLPAGQKEKNYINRKETFKHILDFQVNKEYEFYKNDIFFIFGDLNFRSQKIGLIDLQNHVKISENSTKKNTKDLKNKNILRHSVDIPTCKTFQKKLENNSSESLFGVEYNTSNNINKKSNNLEKNKDKKEKEIDYYNNHSNNDNNKKENEKKCKMDENTFLQFFFKEFLAIEELQNLKEKQLFIYNVSEDIIRFPPTYKYIKGTDLYNLSKRVPSWTDRILFKKGNRIKSLFYDRICLNFSDHKPIVGLFEISL